MDNPNHDTMNKEDTMMSNTTLPTEPLNELHITSNKILETQNNLFCDLLDTIHYKTTQGKSINEQTSNVIDEFNRPTCSSTDVPGIQNSRARRAVRVGVYQVYSETVPA
uniref:Uncharacterized protein n=1 Tax=Cacopsylla melanoneura TaxID=428564 RepID=A0A8D9AGH5_9HEMI